MRRGRNEGLPEGGWLVENELLGIAEQIEGGERERMGWARNRVLLYSLRKRERQTKPKPASRLVAQTT